MPYCFITPILKTALRFRILFLIRHFSLLGSWHRIFILHVLLSCASPIFTPFSFMSFLITSLTSVSVFLYFGDYPLPFSIFSLLHLVPYFSPNDLIISVSLLTYVCHTGSCSYFLIPAFLNTRVSLPYIRNFPIQLPLRFRFVVMLPVDTTMVVICHVLFVCCMHVHGSGCRCDYCIFSRSVDTCLQASCDADDVAL